MHKGTIAAYDAAARRWAQTRLHGSGSDSNGAWARRLRDAVGEGLVLDVGCGPAKLMADLGAPVIGVDASQGMLDLARLATDAPLLMADVEHLPLRSGSFVGVFANFSLQHLPRPNFARSTREIRRVLRSRGVLQVAMHRGTFEGDDRPGDDIPGRWFTYWVEPDLREALEAASFTVVDVDDDGFSLRATAFARDG